MANNPDHPSHRLRVRPSDIAVDMDFSILLSWSFDVLGYNQDMIRHRVDYWKLKNSLANIHHAVAYETIYAGSQTEGIVAYFGSDVDAMLVYNTVICADNIQPLLEYRNFTLFQIDRRDTEAGYTKLKLIEIGNANPYIAESLFESEYNTTYISSELFTNKLMITAKQIGKTDTSRNVTLNKAGPAIPRHVSYRPDVVNGIVFCFKCYCPFLLQSWIRIPRRYNWPSPDTIDDISQMEAHVVPVGCKGSDTYYQEWRICFTKAEIHLVHSLNNTQIKLYVILKMISKYLLKKICREITSYIIKNIVLWMCESLPSDLFTEHQLLNRIFQAIAFLKKCVAQNYLPSYMIPERNLFCGRIKPKQKRKLIVYLFSIREEGPFALFRRLYKICDTMSLLYQEPHKAEFYRIKRYTIEQLFWLKNIRRTFIVPRGMTEEESYQVVLQDELHRNIEIAIVNLVLPEWREIPNGQVIFEARYKRILS